MIRYFKSLLPRQKENPAISWIAGFFFARQGFLRFLSLHFSVIRIIVLIHIAQY
nr:MAG TPA: hypothetical protein [Caudoviricetes sp.]